MNALDQKDVYQFVEQNIGTFHRKRVESLDRLSLSQVLKRKNPYLFKAKYMLTAEQIVRGLIIEPLGHQAKDKNDEFMQSYSQMINKFTRQFAVDFCREDGGIDWERLVQFNSASAGP